MAVHNDVWLEYHRNTTFFVCVSVCVLIVRNKENNRWLSNVFLNEDIFLFFKKENKSFATMKSPIHRTISKRSNQPVSVISDTVGGIQIDPERKVNALLLQKYITKVAERTLPSRYHADNAYLEKEHFGRFLTLYGMICIYVFLVLAIMIGGGLFSTTD